MINQLQAPINYLGQMQQYDPAQSLMGGIQAGLGIRQLQMQREDAEQQALEKQQAAQEEHQFLTDYNDAASRKDYSAMAQLAVKYPKRFEPIKQNISTLQQGDKDTMFSAGIRSFSALQNGDTESALRALDGYKATESLRGRDTEYVDDLITRIKDGKSDSVMSELAMFMPTIDEKKWETAQESLFKMKDRPTTVAQARATLDKTRFETKTEPEKLADAAKMVGQEREDYIKGFARNESEGRRTRGSSSVTVFNGSTDVAGTPADISKMRKSFGESVQFEADRLKLLDSGIASISDALKTSSGPAFELAQKDWNNIVNAATQNFKEIQQSGTARDWASGFADFVSTLSTSTPTDRTMRDLLRLMRKMQVHNARRVMDETEAQIGVLQTMTDDKGNPYSRDQGVRIFMNADALKALPPKGYNPVKWEAMTHKQRLNVVSQLSGGSSDSEMMANPPKGVNQAVWDRMPPQAKQQMLKELREVDK